MCTTMQALAVDAHTLCMLAEHSPKKIQFMFRWSRVMIVLVTCDDSVTMVLNRSMKNLVEA